jgi:4-hydroxy-tetrahydrodipicolinate synthase
MSGTLPVDKSKYKEWAKKHWKGIENCTLPSFTPDMSELSEKGIRWDIRQAIKHGFFSTLICGLGELTFDEAKRYVQIAADEAKDKISANVSVVLDSFEQQFEMLKHAEKVGCHAAMIAYPPSFHPKSEDEIYRMWREMCESTSLPVVLYPTHKFNFERFHPSGFPPKLLSRMAEIDNVVALKIGIIEPGFVTDCFRFCGKKVLVSVPIERWVPLAVSKYGQQWVAGACFELFQSPEKPYFVEYFNLLLQGKMDKAMEIYWKLAPVRQVWEAQLLPQVEVGTYNYPLWKYYQWLVGGNGGFARLPTAKLYEHDKENCRKALRAIGITPREPDEEFYVGRVNYAKVKKLR